MFKELKPPEYVKVACLFEAKKQYTPVYAVINGDFPGRVFVDNTAEPKIAIVWAISRWAYIEGDFENPIFNSSLNDLIRRIIILDSLKMNMSWFELYASNSSKHKKELKRSLKTFNSTMHFESVYVWDKSKYESFRSCYSFPKGLTIEIINIPLLPSNAYDTFIAKDFRSRTAVGFRLKLGDRVVAQCRSNGFTNGNEFMIDVDTFDKNDRGKGYATAAGVALLNYCIENNLKPLWETTEDNIASQRLANKFGFIKNETYPVFAIEFQT
jgi:hypothetical protein